jgi:drug/metabolite transporter (DMT)-like permease
MRSALAMTDVRTLPWRIVTLTVLAMLAFAGNSLLCRAALGSGAIDAASFTLVRLVSGAFVLWGIVRLRTGSVAVAGHWASALALFVYAAGFSYAYLELSAATGALLLFGAVQATMIGRGLVRGERLRALQWAGLMLALAGLVTLLLPGLSTPAPFAAAVMLTAGIAWGVYSLRGKGAGDPMRVTAGNFLRSLPIAALPGLATIGHWHGDATGFALAIASGALTSGLGYAIWYSALPALKATQAATVQLSVPLIAALGAVPLLGEPLTLRLFVAAMAIIGGIALVIVSRRA